MKIIPFPTGSVNLSLGREAHVRRADSLGRVAGRPEFLENELLQRLTNAGLPRLCKRGCIRKNDLNRQRAGVGDAVSKDSNDLRLKTMAPHLGPRSIDTRLLFSLR